MPAYLLSYEGLVGILARLKRSAGLKGGLIHIAFDMVSPANTSKWRRSGYTVTLDGTWLQHGITRFLQPGNLPTSITNLAR